MSAYNKIGIQYNQTQTIHCLHFTYITPTCEALFHLPKPEIMESYIAEQFLRFLKSMFSDYWMSVDIIAPNLGVGIITSLVLSQQCRNEDLDDWPWDPICKSDLVFGWCTLQHWRLDRLTETFEEFIVLVLKHDTVKSACPLFNFRSSLIFFSSIACACSFGLCGHIPIDNTVVAVDTYLYLKS